MPLNCENKVDLKSVCIKVKRKKIEKREEKQARARTLKSICDSDAMLNASCTITFSMLTEFSFFFSSFNALVCMQYAHPNRS